MAYPPPSSFLYHILSTLALLSFRINEVKLFQCKILSEPSVYETLDLCLIYLSLSYLVDRCHISNHIDLLVLVQVANAFNICSEDHLLMNFQHPESQELSSYSMTIGYQPGRHSLQHPQPIDYCLLSSHIF